MVSDKNSIIPFYKKDIPAIIFTIDDGYVPYFSVALTGLLYNSSLDKNYDIVVLYQYISDENKKIILQETAKYENVSLRFYNLTEVMEDKDREKMVSNIEHINEVAYYRLYIPNIFSKYNKVIFLDADICIDGDIADMYDIDTEDNYLVAVRGCSASFPVNYSLCNNLSAHAITKYIKEVIHMDVRDYFNAGVLIFNVRKIIKNKLNYELLRKLDIVSSLQYNDQDILHMCFKDSIKYIGNEWNYCSKFVKLSDKKTYDRNLNSEIKIYHYIGSDKPWIDKYRQYYNIFYTYAMLSPYWKHFIKK